MPGHIPVLRQEAVRLLVTDPEGTYVDATLGRCGHAREILALLGASGRVVGVDCDPEAVARAQANPPAPEPRFVALRGRFSELESALSARGIDAVDGVLADLGLSSDQLDDPARGLSFAREGPLDMRLDPSRPATADALIRTTDEGRLARILSEWGELPKARPAARALRKAAAGTSPLTTRAVREALEPLYPGPARPRRLAQAFQALRIAVNREIDELGALLAAAPRLVRPGGTLCVISYHSLEDRMVKQALRPPRPFDPWIPAEESAWIPITKRPVRPSDEEVRGNPRAGSARLRAATRRGAAA
jgi:16S rRNA (cytosine1402-N4)-methyltransferase